MKKQNKFTFSKQFINTYKEDYQPNSHISLEAEFLDKLNRQGFVANSISRIKTITIIATAARANISLKERKEMQNMLIKD